MVGEELEDAHGIVGAAVADEIHAVRHLVVEHVRKTRTHVRGSVALHLQVSTVVEHVRKTRAHVRGVRGSVALHLRDPVLGQRRRLRCALQHGPSDLLDEIHAARLGPCDRPPPRGPPALGPGVAGAPLHLLPLLLDEALLGAEASCPSVEDDDVKEHGAAGELPVRVQQLLKHTPQPPLTPVHGAAEVEHEQRPQPWE
eukprot:6193220-Pyramimonas_sp.AAC.1